LKRGCAGYSTGEQSKEQQQQQQEEEVEDQEEEEKGWESEAREN
jgi:hypothetical protein